MAQHYVICGQLVIFYVVLLQFYTYWLLQQIGKRMIEMVLRTAFQKDFGTRIQRNYPNKVELKICFRYWAVTQVNYIHQRNIRTIGTMILLIWLTSVIVSLAPLMGWKDEDFLRRINEDKTCMVRLSSFCTIHMIKTLIFIMSDI